MSLASLLALIYGPDDFNIYLATVMIDSYYFASTNPNIAFW